MIDPALNDSHCHTDRCSQNDLRSETSETPGSTRHRTNEPALVSSEHPLAKTVIGDERPGGHRRCREV
jgi:hypothetical protein